MTDEQKERLEAIFSEELNMAVPTHDTDLIVGGYLDSLIFVNLLLYLEQEFDITIQFEQLDFDNFQTINKIAEFVECQAVGVEHS